MLDDRALSLGELSAFMAACSAHPTPAGPRDAALIAVLSRGGLRRSEVVALELAPILTPKPWCWMPAYAKDGEIVCFFQSAQKFNTRYATLGFNDTAKLDDGAMWPAAFALKELLLRMRRGLARSAFGADGEQAA